MISAKIVGDSVNDFGNRITTFVVTMPRIILAEFNTHRMLSKNSASSRAIPFEKMVKSVEENPFIPIAWQKQHKGMQGFEYFTEQEADFHFNFRWLKSRDLAVDNARLLDTKGATKQLINRLLEPFMYHTVIVTGTEWENFFALRCPQYEVIVGDTPSYFRSKLDLLDSLDVFPNVKEAVAGRTDLQWLQSNKGQAEIHMMALAECMWDAYTASKPMKLESGEWHIPYRNNIDPVQIQEEWGNITSSFECDEIAVKIATTMAARTSYTVVGEDQKPLTYKRMVEIHDQMMNASPIHASPFEHCAVVPTVYPMPSNYESNLKGWIQYRKMLPNENVEQKPYKEKSSQ